MTQMIAEKASQPDIDQGGEPTEQIHPEEDA